MNVYSTKSREKIAYFHQKNCRKRQRKTAPLHSERGCFLSYFIHSSDESRLTYAPSQENGARRHSREAATKLMVCSFYKPLRLPLQLAVVEGVAALQRSADGFLSSKRQGHHLGSDVLLHTGVSPFRSRLVN